MRHPTWKFVGLALFVALLSVRCGAPKRVPPDVKSTNVEVEGAEPLMVKVTDVWKRPLRPEELNPTDTTGFLWQYQIKIANQSGMGVNLQRLHLDVRNLRGATWPKDQVLNLRVEGWSEGEVSVEGRLGASDPGALASLTGFETLTFSGQRDDGEPISFTVQVPLY
jgi:hypothetical protein